MKRGQSLTYNVCRAGLTAGPYVVALILMLGGLKVAPTQTAWADDEDNVSSGPGVEARAEARVVSHRAAIPTPARTDRALLTGIRDEARRAAAHPLYQSERLRQSAQGWRAFGATLMADGLFLAGALSPLAGGLIGLVGLSLAVGAPAVLDEQADEALLEFARAQKREEDAGRRIFQEQVADIRKVKGIAVTEGLELEKVIVLAEASTLGFADAAGRATPVLSSGGEALLHRVAEALREAPPATRFQVVGRAAGGTDPQQEVVIARDRAAAVRDFYVLQEGLGPERFEIQTQKADAGAAPGVETVFVQPRSSAPVPALAALAALPGVRLERRAEAVTAILTVGEDAVRFPSGGGEALPGSGPTLDRIAGALNRLRESGQSFEVEIEGFTDGAGPDTANARLSLQRAESVMRELAVRGGPRGRFARVAGRGADSPAASNATEDGRARNRRVVITIKKLVESSG